jgi:predicted DNA-binding transcriptional regulator AlpA
MNTEINTNLEKLISLKETAEMLDLSVRAVYRLIARGILPRPLKIGGATKFFESDLKRYFDSLKNKRDKRAIPSLPASTNPADLTYR